jgi:hypothetical protein
MDCFAIGRNMIPAVPVKIVGEDSYRCSLLRNVAGIHMKMTTTTGSHINETSQLQC